LPRDRPLKRGDKGYILEGHIKHIVDAKSVLIEHFYMKQVPRSFEWEHLGELCLVLTDTKGMKKGEWLSKEKFEVTSTVTFDTPEGPKQIWLLEPFKKE
jgi:hypothetical protein